MNALTRAEPALETRAPGDARSAWWLFPGLAVTCPRAPEDLPLLTCAGWINAGSPWGALPDCIAPGGLKSRQEPEFIPARCRALVRHGLVSEPGALQIRTEFAERHLGRRGEHQLLRRAQPWMSVARDHFGGV